MINGFEQEILEFSNIIKDSTPDYAAMYGYLIQYLNNKYANEEISVNNFLTKEFTMRDIIKSCVWYLEHSNARSVTAIQKYLNAMTKLYVSFLKPKGYDNRNFDEIIPFSQLQSDVKEALSKKKLQEKISFPAIIDSDCKVIFDYFKHNKRPSFVRSQISIIFKLLMTFGFKFRRIKYIRVQDFNFNQKCLFIEIDDGEMLSLDLPSALAIEIKEYIDNPQRPVDSYYMFLNTEGHTISPDFLSYYFSEAKKMCKNADKNGLNRFTATGLAKYAICNMIKQGMNPSIIKLITGMDDIVIDYCIDEVFGLNNRINLNQYINVKLRATNIFESIHTNL